LPEGAKLQGRDKRSLDSGWKRSLCEAVPMAVERAGAAPTGVFRLRV